MADDPDEKLPAEPVCQMRNPIANRYVLVSLQTGRIVRTKLTPGPFKGVPIRKAT